MTTQNNFLPMNLSCSDWDYRFKLICTLCAILVSAVLQHVPSIFMMLIASILLCIWARLSLKLCLQRIMLLTLLFLPCFALIPLQIDASWQVHYSVDGLLFSGLLYLRALTIVGYSIFLLESTPFHLIILSAEKLHFPKALLQITLLTHRFIFSFRREMSNIRRAMIVRGFQNQFNVHSYKTLANVIGMLMIKSIEKTEHLHQAMKCRGYQGKMNSLYQFKCHSKDYYLSVIIILYIIAAALIDCSLTFS